MQELEKVALIYFEEIIKKNSCKSKIWEIRSHEIEEIVEKESTENEFQDDSYKVFSQKHTENKKHRHQNWKSVVFPKEVLKDKCWNLFQAVYMLYEKLRYHSK